MLVRQIGGVTMQIQDAAQVFSDGTGGASDGGIVVETLDIPSGTDASGPATQPDGPIVTVTQEVPADTTPTPADCDCHCQDTTPLMFAGLGIGTALLLAKSGPTIAGTVGKKKIGMLLPLLALGGVAAWWYFSKDDSSSSSSSTSSGNSGSTVDAQRAALTSRYSGQSKQLSVISTADAETLRRWSLIVQMWDAQWPVSRIYATGLDGSSTVSADNSIGKWWELFSQSKGF